MSRPSEDLPRRLLDAGATDLERRLLVAAHERRPPSATSQRIAQGLGLAIPSLVDASAAGASDTASATGSATAVGGPAASTSTGAAVTAGGATGVATGAIVVWPWIAAGVVAVIVAASVLGVRIWRPTTGPGPSKVAPSEIATVRSQPASPHYEPDGPRVELPPEASSGKRRSGATRAASDLLDEVAMLDGARAALAVGAGRRALDILRHYQERYPAGRFRPEATATKVEALVALGRGAEARALGERFVAEHRGSLLAKRVSNLIGPQRP